LIVEFPAPIASPGKTGSDFPTVCFVDKPTVQVDNKLGIRLGKSSFELGDDAFLSMT
jgi:hypothetical protein